MKIQFLGTGAGDWFVPGKTSADYLPGERRLTAAIMDDHIMLNAGPQGFDFCKTMGNDMSKITDVFVSHTHSDHFSEVNFTKFIDAAKEKITIWCEAGAVNNLRLTPEQRERVNICAVPLFEQFEAAGYKVTAMPANHRVPGEKPVHFVFEKDGKSLFYGLDGGWFMADTWEFMREKWFGDTAFTAMILDSTVGDKDGDFRLGTHNSVPMLRLIVAALKENRMVKEDTMLYACHIARTLHDTDLAKVTKLFADFGMTVVNDGDIIEVR